MGKNVHDAGITIRERNEALRSKKMDFRVALGALALAMDIALGVNTAMAAEPAQSPVSPAVSAPPTAKGYGQEVTLNDGSKMSFEALMTMKDEKRKEEIVNQLGRMDKVRIKEYEIQAANQTEKKIDANIQAANQTEKKIDANIQAANQRITGKLEEGQKIDSDLIKKYTEYITNIEQGAPGERMMVTKIKDSLIIPENLRKRAIDLLSKKNVVLAGI